jgi:ribosomal protein S27AE
VKMQTDNSKLALWEKMCPQCGSRLPARKSVCACGHRFTAS